MAKKAKVRKANPLKAKFAAKLQKVTLRAKVKIAALKGGVKNLKAQLSASRKETKVAQRMLKRALTIAKKVNALRAS